MCLSWIKVIALYWREIQQCYLEIRHYISKEHFLADVTAKCMLYSYFSEWQSNTRRKERREQKIIEWKREREHNRRPTIRVNYYSTQLLDSLFKTAFRNYPFMCSVSSVWDFFDIKILMQGTDSTLDNLNGRIYYNFSGLLRWWNSSL